MGDDDVTLVRAARPGWACSHYEIRARDGRRLGTVAKWVASYYPDEFHFFLRRARYLTFWFATEGDQPSQSFLPGEGPDAEPGPEAGVSARCFRTRRAAVAALLERAPQPSPPH